MSISQTHYNVSAVMLLGRVTGKWVEEVKMNEDGQILRVINPDPGGVPNIPYDEKNNTDVPVGGPKSSQREYPCTCILVHENGA